MANLAENWIKDGNFGTIFNLAETKHKENDLEFFNSVGSLFSKKSLGLIEKNNKTVEFLTEVTIFFKKNIYNEQEKRSLVQGVESDMFFKALETKQFEVAEYLNGYRGNKKLNQNRSFLNEQLSLENHDVLEKLFEYSTDVEFNNSEILTLMYHAGYKNFNFYEKIIKKYKLDINGINEVYLKSSCSGTFTHYISMTVGTISNQFFRDFIHNFADKIDFDIPLKVRGGNSFNLIELIENTPQFEDTERLEKLSIILDYDNLSEKHLSQITKIVLSEKNASNYFDNKVMEKLFSHNNFNSNLFDRESVLKQILSLDLSSAFSWKRNDSGGTINPTSVLLDTFFRNTSPIQIKEEHPLLYWLRKADNHFCKDTFVILMKHYQTDLNNIGLSKIRINESIVKELMKYGVKQPVKKGFFSSWFGGSENDEGNDGMKVDKQNQLQREKPLQTHNEVFNEKLFEQIKDNDIKKYIESIKLNAEQFVCLANSAGYEEKHYIDSLLPKFLNKTIENYLYFIAIEDTQEAKDCALVQLKLLNKKTFDYLNKALESEKEKINTQQDIHQKIIKNY